MRKILAIAIVLAMVIPVSLSAEYTTYDYTEVTAQLEVIEDNIDAGNITFDTEAHKQSFLSGISSVYSNRDSENWATCATLLEGLATYAVAVSWIENETVAGNVKVICNCEAAVYDDYDDVLENVQIEDGVLQQVKDYTDENSPLIPIIDDPTMPEPVHYGDCEYWPQIPVYV